MLPPWKLRRKKKSSFLKKRSNKLLSLPAGITNGRVRAATECQSFFASFCSQKEDLS
jgi:hypothetical protein